MSFPSSLQHHKPAPCGPACSQVTGAIHELSESLGLAVDAKDPHTRRHSEEVAVTAHALALASGLGALQADAIHIAGHLHDIGKIGVPDTVLAKPGPLNSREWACILRHPEAGARILEPVKALRSLGVPDMVRHHHERYDGRGYPAGLRGREIPQGARIIALADSLSAMLQDRPYRRALDYDQACTEIEACVGAQFDPEAVEAFLGVKSRIYGLYAMLQHDPERRGEAPA